MSQSFIDDCFASSHATQTDMQNIENNFAALKSAFSGTAAPSNLVAGMWWFDTTANILKLRNEANNAWQSVWNFASNKPVITNLSNEITGAMIAAAIKDPAAGTAGLRTLGSGATQARPGNHSHTGEVTGATALTIANGAVIEARLGASAVAQAKLKTSQGSVSSAETSFTNYTLPGGEYGFYPRLKTATTSSAGAKICEYVAITTSYVTYIALQVQSGRTVYAQQRYITSSGETHWVFIMRDKITKQTLSMYQSPDHPCFGNGGKPLLVSHPFGNFDKTKHEIIVINPSFEEIEQMELETIVDDETKPDKDLLQVIAENYEIDENSNPAWPTKPVTVGLPKHIKDKETGKKALADYRFMGTDDIVEPIKKVIPKPSYIKVKKLKRKQNDNTI